jgi:uncharacterized membrane protein YgaE (UPF0421/DUF939 family)
MILLWGYNLAGAQGSIWAIITAVLILQPGLDNSMSASGVRIVATLLGASVGTAATLLIGAGAVALLAGILVTVILCYLVRLDLHVRQACLTVPSFRCGIPVRSFTWIMNASSRSWLVALFL